MGRSLVADRHVAVAGATGSDSSSRDGLTLAVSSPTPERILQLAQGLVPKLRERQAECEQLGRPPASTHQELVDTGLYRVLQPRRFGGYEFDLSTFFSIMATIARGCPSTGWVLALTAGHAHTLAALFPEETQVETFGPNGEYRAPL